MLISGWGSYHHSCKISYTPVNADTLFTATQCTMALRFPGKKKKFFTCIEPTELAFLNFRYIWWISVRLNLSGSKRISKSPQFKIQCSSKHNLWNWFLIKVINLFLTRSSHLFILLSFFFFFLSEFKCIRYKICINKSTMEASLGKVHALWLSTVMKTQKSSPSLVFLQNTFTRRAEHNSCPEQRASAKAPTFPSWENTISPQVAQQTHRVPLPEKIKCLNKKVMHFSHVWREIQWIKIIQCHHEPALKKHMTIYSEWNGVPNTAE